MSRNATSDLLDMVKDGLLDRDNVILACVNYMSEDDVAEMCRINEFVYDDEDDDEEKDCREPYTGDDPERLHDEAEYARGYHETRQAQLAGPPGSDAREAAYLEMEQRWAREGFDY